MSALLFSIVMDVIITKLEVRGNISKRLKQISTYADDIVIIGRTNQAMIDILNKLQKNVIQIWTINKRK